MTEMELVRMEEEFQVEEEEEVGEIEEGETFEDFLAIVEEGIQWPRQDEDPPFWERHPRTSEETLTLASDMEPVVDFDPNPKHIIHITGTYLGI